MAVRIKDTTRVDLCSVPLPVYSGDTYTVISHQSVMDYALTELGNAGFNVQGESYRCTGDGNIAQGIYHLTYNNDPEIGMMFAWSNSYNKQMRFKCAIGGYVFVCMNGMLTGDMGTWNRKHTGTADEETEKTILDQITNAHVYYNQLVSDKDKMKQIILTSKEQAGLLGILFAEYEILTTEQISLVKEQMDKPSFTYNADKNSLWSFYNHITLALKKSHPRTWMEDQRKLHIFVALEFDLYNFNPNVVTVDPLLVEEAPVVIDPNQTSILDQIEEMAEDGKRNGLTELDYDVPEIEPPEVRYPVEPTDYFDTDIIGHTKEMSPNEIVDKYEAVSRIHNPDVAEVELPTNDMGETYPAFSKDSVVTLSRLAPDVAEIESPVYEGKIYEADAVADGRMAEIASREIDEDMSQSPGPEPDAAELATPMAGSDLETGTLLESIQEGSSGDSTEGREVFNVGKEPEDLGNDKIIVLDFGDSNPVIGPAPDVADLDTGDLVGIALENEIVFPKRKVDVAEISNEDLGEILIDEHSKIEDEFDFSLSDDEDAGELDFDL